VRIEDLDLSPEEILPLFRNIPFFESLTDEELRRLTSTVRSAQADGGEVLYREGEEPDAFYIVREGRVEITAPGSSGGMENRWIRGPGESLGELALVGSSHRGETARTEGPVSLLRMEGSRFRELLDDRALTLRVLTSLATALRGLEVRLAQERKADPIITTGESPGDSTEISRLLQRGLIPPEAPRIHGFDIAAGTSLEDDGEGRTIWDYTELGDGQTALLTLNVQGDGLPPAHYLAVARSLLRELARDQSGLKGLLARINSGLAAAVVEGMEQYVEAGVLLPSGGGVEWAGAGRCPGAIIRRSGIFEEFSTHGPPLGMLDGFMYGTQRMELGAGDAVIVLSEASQGLFRGAADLVASLQGKPVGEVVTMVHKALKKAHPEEARETSVLFVRRQ
jgi:CRP-like cAMP-binding protein